MIVNGKTNGAEDSSGTLGSPLAKIQGEGRHAHDDGSLDACIASWHDERNPRLILPLHLLKPIELAMAVALGNAIWGERRGGGAREIKCHHNREDIRHG